MNKEYCVAIRTLGTAGEKYQTLLDSLVAQTLPPVPQETVGVEEIVRCEKGMVTQRSLPFEEVDTDYILCLDDDLYLPPTLVEGLFEVLIKNNADCISPGMANYKASKKDRIISFIHSFTLPHFSKKWDVIVSNISSWKQK